MTAFDPDTATAQECREEAEEIDDAIAGLRRVTRRGHCASGEFARVFSILDERRIHLRQLAFMKELPPERMIQA